jgi:hypothetical protein
MTGRCVLLLGALVLAVGCGGSPDTSDAADPDTAEGAVSFDDVESCELVTRNQVSIALGLEVGEGSESGLSGCEWRAESGPRVALQVFAGSMLAAGTCDSQRSLMSGREEDVPGLGDSARWGSGGDLVVCSRRAVVRVDIDNTSNDPRDDREVIVQIARHALERLGS